MIISVGEEDEEDDRFEILCLRKPPGITPIQYWLKQDIPYKAAICGKLDPMAEGQLLILLDKSSDNSSNRRKKLALKMDELCNLEKIYEFGILIGLTTETDDKLGHVSFFPDLSLPSSDYIIDELKDYASKLTEQQYHIFSAKRVHNAEDLSQPLWAWARQGRLNEIEVPQHRCFIKDLEILTETEIRPNRIYARQFKQDTINLLNANKENLDVFEIRSCIESWENLRCPLEFELEIINVRCRVTGGTFIRQIVRDLYKKTGIPMLCSYIDRKKVIIPDR